MYIFIATINILVKTIIYIVWVSLISNIVMLQIIISCNDFPGKLLYHQLKTNPQNPLRTLRIKNVVFIACYLQQYQGVQR